MSSLIQHVCPHCMAVNRVPQSRNAANAKCGKCKKPLFGAPPVELTDGNFTKFITKTHIPVVVDFWAPWCGPCQMMGPEFAKAARVLEPQVRFAKLNTEAHQSTAARYKISGIPNMMIFKDGKAVAQKAGAMRVRDIESWVKSSL